MTSQETGTPVTETDPDRVPLLGTGRAEEGPVEPVKRRDPGLLVCLSVVLLCLVALGGGPLIWMASIMGSDGCGLSDDSGVWACTVPGQMTIAGIVPVMSLVAVVLALIARRRWKHAILRPDLAVPLAWLIVLGSWFLSIALAMTSSS